MSRYFRHSTADYKNELDIPKPPVLQYSKLFQSTKKFKENGLYSPRTQLGIHRPEVKVCEGKHLRRIHSFYFRLIFKKFVPGHSPFFLYSVRGSRPVPTGISKGVFQTFRFPFPPISGQWIPLKVILTIFITVQILILPLMT